MQFIDDKIERTPGDATQFVIANPKGEATFTAWQSKDIL
jgi:hypothetical protein